MVSRIVSFVICCYNRKMITTQNNTAGALWRILTSPTPEEIQTLMKEMDIKDEYLEEISTPTPQPVCLNLHGITYAVFHIPVRTNKHSLHFEEAEVDLLIDDKTLSTIVYTPVEKLDLHVDHIVRHDASTHPAELWWHVLTKMYEDIHREVDSLIVQVKGLREKVFTNKEHIKLISDIHRAYLAIDLPLSTHEDIIESIHQVEHPGMEKSTPRSWSKLRGEYHRLNQKLEKLGAYIHELRDTQNSLISARQNSLIQTFTILTFIFLPINFLAALFGMNATNMPVVGHPNGFWILLGGFAVLSFIMLGFFKLRRWL